MHISRHLNGVSSPLVTGRSLSHLYVRRRRVRLMLRKVLLYRLECFLKYTVLKQNLVWVAWYHAFFHNRLQMVEQFPPLFCLLLAQYFISLTTSHSFIMTFLTNSVVFSKNYFPLLTSSMSHKTFCVQHQVRRCKASDEPRSDNTFKTNKSGNKIWTTTSFSNKTYLFFIYHYLYLNTKICFI